MISKENGVVKSPLSMLTLIDDLQRLGLSYHYMNEISNVLDYIHPNFYENHEKWANMDLNLRSLGFRLLRQHGYHVPQGI